MKMNELVSGARLTHLADQLEATTGALRKAYSAMLAQDMGARLEDGTPVISLVMEGPLVARYVAVFNQE